MQMREKLNAIEDAVEQLKTLNYRQYEDRRIDRLADTIARAAAALRE